MAEPAPDRPDAPSSAPHDWETPWAAELRRLALSRPWGPAVMAIGWVHLAAFLACQAVYSAGVRDKWPSLALWGGEVAAVLLTMRAVAGRDWLRESLLVALIVRVWGTFLILSFNVASLNTLTGFTVDWFKPVWCTLASFGFATMAWLFGGRYLVLAFQMYFTGLLLVALPGWNYLIHGLSWCAALQWVGWDLARRRDRLARLAPGPEAPPFAAAPRDLKRVTRDRFTPQMSVLYTND